MEQIIDLFITPLAGGVGGYIGLTFAVKYQPEKFEGYSGLMYRLLSGVAIAVILFCIKIFT